jgi:hypothetical protein
MVLATNRRRVKVEFFGGPFDGDSSVLSVDASEWEAFWSLKQVLYEMQDDGTGRILIYEGPVDSETRSVRVYFQGYGKHEG